MRESEKLAAAVEVAREAGMSASEVLDAVLDVLTDDGALSEKNWARHLVIRELEMRAAGSREARDKAMDALGERLRELALAAGPLDLRPAS